VVTPPIDTTGHSCGANVDGSMDDDGMMGDVPVRWTTDDGRRTTSGGATKRSVPPRASAPAVARERVGVSRARVVSSRLTPGGVHKSDVNHQSSCFGRVFFFLSATDGLKRKTTAGKGPAGDAGVTEVSRDADDGEERDGVARGDAGTASRGVAGRRGRRRRRGLSYSSSGETEARVRR